MPASLRSYRAAIDELVLPRVSKPSRYVAGERNSSRKDPAAAELRVALAFPDAYEIGMSHLGLKVLYQLLNRRPGVAAERAYAPWIDAEALMRAHGIPLVSHESAIPLRDFDIVGFTLQYELSYTTILGMLELAGIPLRSADRTPADPVVIAGGPCAFNPEPLAPFIDFFLIGDAEEAIHEICDVVRAWKGSGRGRERVLEDLARIEGGYVPLLHRGETVRKRTSLSWGEVDYGAFPIPFMDIVHDRVSIEVMRGCTQGCRFCQAGYQYRPFRERSAEEIQRLAVNAVKATGYEEVSLSSLSIADLSCLTTVVPNLMDALLPERVSLSLPSLRVEALVRNPELAEEIGRVRKTGFTIAPEAGSRRLRKVINKEGFDEEHIFAAVRNAARSGWESVKFYFMIGLPTETQEDLDELVRVAKESARIARAESQRGFGLTVSVSSFVPKPFTAFQWFPQEPMAVLQEKQRTLRARLREARIDFKWHHVESSLLEAVCSIGGREVAPALERAFALGCRFDGWTEQLDLGRWMRAFAEVGLDPHATATRARALDEPLPWDFIDAGISKKFLQREYQKALQVRGTPDCHVGPCAACGEICLPNWPTWAEKLGILPPEYARKKLEVAALPSAATLRAANAAARPTPWAAPQPGGAATPAGEDGRGPGVCRPRATGDPAAGPGAHAAGCPANLAVRQPGDSAIWPRLPDCPITQLPEGPIAGSPDSRIARSTPRPGPAAVQRIQFEFQKVGVLRFLSHLEVMRALARALRRAGVPLAYSQGYNPQPRLSLAQALPVGVSGLRELGEVDLSERLDPPALVERWNAQLPRELSIRAAWDVPLSGPSLASAVRGAVYVVALESHRLMDAALAWLTSAEGCAAFLDGRPIPVQAFKKGQAIEVDARPYIEAFRPLASNGTATWELVLRAGPGGSVKAQAVMEEFLRRAGAPSGTTLVRSRWVPGALEPLAAALRVERTGLLLDRQA